MIDQPTPDSTTNNAPSSAPEPVNPPPSTEPSESATPNLGADSAKSPIEQSTTPAPAEQTPVATDAPSTPESNMASSLAPVATNEAAPTPPSEPLVLSEQEVAKVTGEEPSSTAPDATAAPETSAVTAEKPAEEMKTEDTSIGEPPQNNVETIEPDLKEIGIDDSSSEKNSQQLEDETTMKEPVEDSKPEVPPMDTQSPAKEVKTEVAAMMNDPKKMAGAPLPDADGDHDTASSVAGEIVSVFGMIIAVLMLATPLLRDLFGTQLFELIRTVGWLTASAALFIGFIVLLFAKGGWVLKIITLLFLLVAVFFYIAANQPAWLGGLAGSLEPLIDFYR